VLDAIARALQLDDAERTHLYHLVTNHQPTAATGRRHAMARVRPSVQRIIDSLTDAPAFVRNRRLDILAANTLGRALYSAAFDDPRRPVNLARYRFLNPDAVDFYVDADKAAYDTVALLRQEAGRAPHDKDLIELVGELSTRSDDFRTRWAHHDVKFHRTGQKQFHHAVVGDLMLDYDALELPGEPDQLITVYTAEPDSPTHHALRILASWTTTAPEARQNTDV
jgi:MmyB-like transcription regulator ligand binding domain